MSESQQVGQPPVQRREVRTFAGFEDYQGGLCGQDRLCGGRGDGPCGPRGGVLGASTGCKGVGSGVDGTGFQAQLCLVTLERGFTFVSLSFCFCKMGMRTDTPPRS